MEKWCIKQLDTGRYLTRVGDGAIGRVRTWSHLIVDAMMFDSSKDANEFITNEFGAHVNIYAQKVA